jgi:exonuclease III
MMAQQSVTVDTLKICTYNMHSFNNGRSLLEYLCTTHDVILVQEHWLSSCDLYKLKTFNDKFICYGVSAMDEKLSSAILVGRPFGGVAILWKKELSNFIKTVDTDCDRYVAIQFCINNLCKFVMHCVYFPCNSNSQDYIVDASNIISKI